MTEEATLNIGEYHPAADIAMTYVKNFNVMKYLEAISSCALENNRMAEICLSTLRRLENGEPVSDRYLMGLAWFLWALENGDV